MDGLFTDTFTPDGWPHDPAPPTVLRRCWCGGAAHDVAPDGTIWQPVGYAAPCCRCACGLWFAAGWVRPGGAGLCTLCAQLERDSDVDPTRNHPSGPERDRAGLSIGSGPGVDRPALVDECAHAPIIPQDTPGANTSLEGPC